MGKHTDELETISKILAYEETIFSEYKEKLLNFKDDIKGLGIEIRSTIRQVRGLYGARVEPYDLKENNRLPRFYKSQIYGLAYKDDQVLAKQEEYDKRIISLFPLIFPLVSVSKTWFQRKIKEFHYYEPPLQSFDENVISLLDKIKKLNLPL